MLGDINYNLEPQEWTLALARPDRTIIAYLTEAFDITFINKLTACSELKFKLPYYVSDKGRKTVNEHFDMLKGDYLILVNDEKYYMIVDPQQVDEGDKAIKEVECYSLEYELSKKVIRGYKAEARKLYDIANEKDDNGLYRGILNYVSTLTSWSVDFLSIPADILTKYRAVDISEKSVLDMLNEVQKTFNCFFQYDTINKKIFVRNLEDVGENRGLYISNENYLKNIKNKIKNNDIVTRLRVYGKNNISINGISPTGTDYIENYTYYKNTDYMTQELIDALNAYEALVASKTGDADNPAVGTFNYYVQQLNTLQQQATVLWDTPDVGMSALKLKASQIEDNIGVATAYATAQGQDRAYWVNELNNINTTIATKQVEIDTNTAEQNAVIENMSTLHTLLAKENNFTSDQIINLDYFIREKTWQDNNIDDSADLYDEGVTNLAKLSQPAIDFQIDIMDFMQLVEYQHDWDKLVLGDIINIVFPNFNMAYEVRLVSFNHSPEKNSITLELSNKDYLDNPSIYLADLLKSAVSTSTSVDMSKFKWDMSEDNNSQISQILNSAWDAAKNAVVAGKNQNVVINDKGVFIKDSTNAQEQVGMINNVIAMTTDGWETAKLAITPNGIYAPALYSTITVSAMLNIINSSGTFSVDAQGVTLDGMALTITNGIQESQLSSDVANAYVKLGHFYNNLKFDTSEGIVATRNDNTLRAKLNATEGLRFETSTNNGQSWTAEMYYDILTKRLILHGVVQAVDFQDTNGVSFLTSNKDKISGGMIEGKGLIIRDSNNNITFKVDGTTGNLTLGGSITWNTRPSYTSGDMGTLIPNLSQMNAVANTQAAIFNGLTVNGTKQGLFIDEFGNLYMNATYIKVGATTNATALTTYTQDQANAAENNAKTHANNKDTTLRTDLRLSASLPNAITLDSSGITATASGTDKWARLNNNGLEINNGAIVIRNSSGATIIDGTGVSAEYLTGTYITGKTLRTASSGARIELSGTGLISYNSGTTKHGVVISSSSGYSKVEFYQLGTYLGCLEGSGGNVNLTSEGNMIINAGTFGRVLARGTWDFDDATVIGLTAVFG